MWGFSLKIARKQLDKKFRQEHKDRMASTPKAMIVIPTYNESQNIVELVEHILAIAPEVYITIVDDNSPDGTGQIAEELAARYPTVAVLHRSAKQGLGPAYIEGFQYALSQGAEYIFEMDADFSHDPNRLPDFLEAIRDYDLVLGSRYLNGVRVEGWPFRRLLLSKFANIYASTIMVLPAWDATSGFRCYRREVLETIDLTQIRSDGYAFQIEMLYYTIQHGFRITEIPFLFRERQHGCSKISRSVVREAFWLVLRLHAPLCVILKHLRYLFHDYDEFVKSHPATQKRPH